MLASYLKKGLRVGIILKIVQSLSSLFTAFIVIEMINLKAYGNFASIIITSSLLQSIIFAGLNFNILQKISYKKNKEKTIICGLIYICIFGFSIMILLFTIFFSFNKDYAVLLGILIFPLFTIIKYLSYISRALDSKLFLKCNATEFIILPIFLLFTANYLKINFGIILFSYVIIIISQLIVLRKYLLPSFIFVLRKNLFTKMIYVQNSSLKYFIGDLLNTGISTLFLFIPILSGIEKEFIGIFNLCKKFTSISSIIMQQMKNFIIPNIVINLKHKSKNNVICDIKQISKIGFILSILSSFLVISILELNSKYSFYPLSEIDSINYCIYIMLVGVIVESWFGPIGILCRLLKLEKVQNLVILTSFVISMVVYFSLDAHFLMVISISMVFNSLLWRLLMSIILFKVKNYTLMWFPKII